MIALILLLLHSLCIRGTGYNIVFIKLHLDMQHKKLNP